MSGSRVFRGGLSIVCGLTILAITSAGTLAGTRMLMPSPALVAGMGDGLAPTVSIFSESTGKRVDRLKPFGDGLTTGARVAVGDVCMANSKIRSHSLPDSRSW
jgi:hypothetical protein